MNYFLASLPILVLLSLMIFLRWGGHRAGPASWLFTLVLSLFAFGLNFQVFWVSQLKGLFLSVFVLAIIWSALLLYQLVKTTGGIQAISETLQIWISDRELLWILMAWSLSALLEGIAGFGVPIAVVAPMLVGLGVQPIIAVAAVAVGHAWSVTFGDMGVVFQTLLGVVKMEASELVLPASLLLGISCLFCGLFTAWLLKATRKWPYILVIGVCMGLVQTGLNLVGLTTLGAFGAGLAGMLAGIILNRIRGGRPSLKPTPLPLRNAVFSYGLLSILAIILYWPGVIHDQLNSIVWQMQFPIASTLNGFTTPANTGQAFRPLIHPGVLIFLISIISALVFSWKKKCTKDDLKSVIKLTWQTAVPTSIGVLATIGLATMMDHTGMTQLLAEGLAKIMERAYPLISPLIGMLGAFATGSNNNSNVLFGNLQKNIAVLLSIAPAILVSAQTAGGSLGSMLAPAKIIVGCSTVNLKGSEGEVLKMTIPAGLVIGLLIGMAAFLIALI